MTSDSQGADLPEEGLSTAQIAEAVKVTRQTVNNWKDRGLLPAPEVLHLGARGRASVWPTYALPLALFVEEALKKRPVAQVARQIKPLLEKDPAWVNAQIASGKTITLLLRELAPGI